MHAWMIKIDIYKKKEKKKNRKPFDDRNQQFIARERQYPWAEFVGLLPKREVRIRVCSGGSGSQIQLAESNLRLFCSRK